jgi:hypothetical protein
MAKPFERLIVVADEFSTSDRPFALARRLAIAGDLSVQVVCAVVDDARRDETPGWRLKRRLDAHGLSSAELRVLRLDESPELALAEYLAGHDGGLVLRATSAGGHDGGPLLDRVAETIMSHIARPLLLLGPRQANPRRDEHMSPVAVRDDATDRASLAAATERWTSTFPDTATELVDIMPPDPWPGSSADRTWPDAPPTTPGAIALHTADLDDAVASYLGGRRDAVVVVSSDRWPNEASHWWATARRLVRHQTCPVLVVPVVGFASATPASGSSTPRHRDGPVTVPTAGPR